MTNSKAKILLVEDDKALIEMYAIKFKEDGFNLLMAEDGLTGLELAKKELPDVVLLDIMLPKMDGFAILAELKKDAKTQSIAILMLSNLGQQSDIEKGKKMGANDYVVKASMTPKEVVEKVKSYLNK